MQGGLALRFQLLTDSPVIVLNAFKGKKKKMQERTASRPFANSLGRVLRKKGVRSVGFS
jgi:hypothetical protein